MTYVLLAAFHVRDPLDGVGFRCLDESGPYAVAGGTFESVHCTRRSDHVRRGSPLHRAVLQTEDPVTIRDLYWTKETT